MNNSYNTRDQNQVYDNNSAYIYNGNNGTINNNNRYNANNCRPFADFRSDQLNELPRGFLQDFINAYFECLKGKRKTANAANYTSDWERKTIKLAYDVFNGEYVPKTSIAFVITSPKLREVEAANFADRIVQTYYCHKVIPCIDKYLSPRQFSCRTGKGTDAAIVRATEDLLEATHNFTKRAWVAKIDIKSFFMSIDKPLLVQRMTNYLQKEYDQPDKETILYLTRVLYESMPAENCFRKSSYDLWSRIPREKSLFTAEPNKGLPIGNYHVHIGANFYIAPLMHFFADIGINRVVNYTDDFLIVTEDKDALLRKLPLVEDFIRSNLKLNVNRSKFYLQPAEHGVNFLGRTIKSQRIYASKRILHNAFERIRLAEIYATGKPYYYKATAGTLMHSVNSTLGFPNNLNEYKTRSRICGAIAASEYHRYLKADAQFTQLNYIKDENRKRQS